jgi:hypothetical protein
MPPRPYETRITPNGYKEVRLPFRSENRHGWVLEHRLIVELDIGVRLPQEVHVHHRDRNPTNNVRENLLLCPDEDVHRSIHEAIDRGDARSIREWEKHCQDYEQTVISRLSKSKANIFDAVPPGNRKPPDLRAAQDILRNLPTARRESIEQTQKRLLPARLARAGEAPSGCSRELTNFDKVECDDIQFLSSKDVPNHLIAALFYRTPESIERKLQSLKSAPNTKQG